MATEAPVKFMKQRKACDGCTACCSGALHGQAHGHAFWKGRPCHFVGANGCTIYKDRPHDPCKTYECGYLALDWVPHWMRPDLSDVIITAKVSANKKIPYIEVLEYRNKITPEVLSFIFMAHVNGHFQNIKYQVNGGWNRIGSKEFLEESNVGALL